jgi:hypothetical protein
MKRLFVLHLLFLTCHLSFAQSVGVGTTAPNPAAMLHVDAGPDINKGLLVTGTSSSLGTVPDLGIGSRMMYYPGKVAFRAGYVPAPGTQWNNANVGLYSTATGYGTMANATGTVAMGINNYASGYGAVAMGYQTTADGPQSTTFGMATAAGGTASTALGYYTTAYGYSSTVVGMYNDPVVGGAEVSGPSSATPLFVVGNGNSSGTRSNALVVNKSGDVAIGRNTSPLGRVHVRTNSTVSYPQMYLEEQANDYARLTFANSTPTFVWTIAGSPQSTNAASVLNFYFNNFGDVLSLRGNGNAFLAGTLTQNSDARLKRDIQPITQAMQHLMKVNGYHYYWQDKQRDADLQTGILAQEIQKVFPELVKADANGTLSVNYPGLIPYVIEAAKEQQQEIETLKARLQKLEEAVLRLSK